MLALFYETFCHTERQHTHSLSPSTKRHPRVSCQNVCQKRRTKRTIHDRLRQLMGAEITEEEFWNRFTFGKMLGTGSTCKVYEAFDTVTNETVAVKVFDKVEMIETRSSMAASEDKIVKERAVDRACRRLLKIISELEIVKTLHHPNIIQFRGAYETSHRICIVYERTQGSDLLEYLLAHGRMQEPQAAYVARQLLSAVQYCHDRRLYHRDLKLENVLISPELKVKLIDFGLSEYVPEGKELHSVCGTPLYCSPEILFMHSSNEHSREGFEGGPADVWSVGIFLFAILTGCTPFDDSTLMRLREDVFQNSICFPPYLSYEVKGMLKAILNPDPTLRPTVQDLMEYGWIKAKGLHETQLVVSHTTHTKCKLSRSKTVSSSPLNKAPAFHRSLFRPSSDGTENTARSSLSYDEISQELAKWNLGNLDPHIDLSDTRRPLHTAFSFT